MFHTSTHGLLHVNVSHFHIAVNVSCFHHFVYCSISTHTSSIYSFLVVTDCPGNVVCIHTYIHTYKDTYTVSHTYIHTCTMHTHTHTHTHTQTGTAASASLYQTVGDTQIHIYTHRHFRGGIAQRLKPTANDSKSRVFFRVADVVADPQRGEKGSFCSAS